MNSSSEELARAQKIAGLTRRYAQNRFLGVVIALLVFAALFTGISVLSYVGGVAYRGGNLVLFGACLVALVPILAAVVYMSVPMWGGRRCAELTSRLYHEGRVSISVPQQKERQRMALLLAAAFGCCTVGAALLGFLGTVPTKYAQPVSALYVVPFLVGLGFLMRPAVSYVSLLWPILYGLHALLIMAGAPILFTGPWESLNIGIPIVGYGLLAALIGHACNRRALYKLRQIAAVNDSRPGGIEGAPER